MQTTNIQNAAKVYLENVSISLHGLALEKIEKIARILFEAYTQDKKIILMGNGGSAATASHFVCDLAKGTASPGKKRFKAMALNDNTPLVTAYANDSSYEDIFSEQLKNAVEAGDVVIAISGSGNSKNVLKAVELASRNSAITIGLTGFQGGRLKDLVSECLIVPNNTMEQIEDIHLVVLHAIKIVLMGMLTEERR